MEVPRGRVRARLEELTRQWSELIESEFPGLDLGLTQRPHVLVEGSEEWCALRALARSSLHFFTVFVLRRDRLGGVGSFHWEFCRRLETAERPQMHLYYRAAFKSTIGGCAYPLWRFCQENGVQEYSHLKLVSDIELGRTHMEWMMRQVEHNETLRALFPEVQRGRREWTTTRFTLAGRDPTTLGSSMEVRTLKQGHAGRHVGGISMDDLVNEQNYESRAEQDRLKKRMLLLWPTLDTDELFIYATRYADYDLNGWAIEQYYPRDMDVFVQPVRGRGWVDPVTGKVVVEDDGVFAHPEEWDDERLEVERRRMSDEHDNGEFLFRCQYFLDTSSQAGKSLRREWLAYEKESEVRARQLTYFFGVDPASGRGTSRPALAIVGIDRDRKLYVMWADKDFATEADLIDAVFAQYRLWRPAAIWVERYGHGGHSFDLQLRARCAVENEWPPFHFETHGTEHKDAFIRNTLRPQYQWGNVVHVEGLRGGPLEEELMAFPFGKERDLLDALSYAVQAALKVGPDYWQDADTTKRVLWTLPGDNVAPSWETLMRPATWEDDEARHPTVEPLRRIV